MAAAQFKGIRRTRRSSISFALKLKPEFSTHKIVKEGMHVVDIDENIDVTELKPSTRIALRRRGYSIHAILPKKFDPIVKLSKVQNIPECTYDMIDGLDEQIKEIKEVIELPIRHPELFEHLGIAEPKVDIIGKIGSPKEYRLRVKQSVAGYL